MRVSRSAFVVHSRVESEGALVGAPAEGMLEAEGGLESARLFVYT